MKFMRSSQFGVSGSNGQTSLFSAFLKSNGNHTLPGMLNRGLLKHCGLLFLPGIELT